MRGGSRHAGYENGMGWYEIMLNVNMIIIIIIVHFVVQCDYD